MQMKIGKLSARLSSDAADDYIAYYVAPLLCLRLLTSISSAYHQPYMTYVKDCRKQCIQISSTVEFPCIAAYVYKMAKPHTFVNIFTC